MNKELETPIEHYVEKLLDVKQKISDLRKEEESIVDELIAHNCPFKVGDCVSVTDKDINRGIPRYGMIKYIKYNLEYKRFFSISLIKSIRKQKFVIESKSIIQNHL